MTEYVAVRRISEETDLMTATSRTSRIEELFGANAVAECCAPQIADERATELVRATSAGPAGGYWEGYAHLALRCYLLAAAFCGADSAQVIAWARNPEDPSAAQVLKDHAADVPHGWIETLEAGLPAAGVERFMVFGTLLHAMHPNTHPYPVR